METLKQFTIKKKMTDTDVNSIIVIPKLSQKDLSKGTIVELNIKVFEGVNSGK